jgi:hypothetical protein
MQNSVINLSDDNFTVTYFTYRHNEFLFKAVDKIEWVPCIYLPSRYPLGKIPPDTILVSKNRTQHHQVQVEPYIKPFTELL